MSNFYQFSSFLENGELKKDGYLILNSNFLDGNQEYTGIIYQSSSVINRSNPLQIYFGVNATQDINNLYIKKSDLTGLTPSANNTAESLLIALLLRNIDVTNDNDDAILITLFDTYIQGNKIKNTLLIQIDHPATVIDNEIQEPSTEINPMNYGYLL